MPPAVNRQVCWRRHAFFVYKVTIYDILWYAQGRGGCIIVMVMMSIMGNSNLALSN